MMNCAGVYSITTPSEQQYVGSAINFAGRWKRHLTYLRSGKHHNSPLQRAFAKYGEASLKFSILLICAPKDLLQYKQSAIDALNPEYNVCRVAGSHLGRKRSRETSLRMSEAQRRRAKPSEQTKMKQRVVKLGTKRTDEAKAKTSQSLKTHYSSEIARTQQSERSKRALANPETRLKISKALTGLARSEETRARMSLAQTGHPSKLKGIPRPDWVKDKIRATKRAANAAK